MNIYESSLSGVFICEPLVHGDHRGYFMETFTQKELDEALGKSVVFLQDNESFTEKKGTLRGLHFQNAPSAQAKLIRVTDGAVLDVAVDIRKGSPNYLKWVGVELSADNKRQIYIPRGFAHGFLTLTDNVRFLYKVDSYYDAAADRGISFRDPSIGVDWGCDNPILSDKDANAVLLADSDCNFVYGEI
ncbi:MAG: dTDP-4-dehydrorhamnose 3,5-epimerase [Eubacteriaceae bacterium]|nr:dTDP-4-dehydrorhamnose 3,5-epimerase [Eubacteriaceae bacterium]